MKKLIFAIFVLSFIWVNFAFAQEDVEISFFYSDNCLGCLAAKEFLNEVEQSYSEVKINRYAINDPKNWPILEQLCKECGAESYMGLVPLIFVGEEFFLNFDNPKGSLQTRKTILEKEKGLSCLLSERSILITILCLF